MLDSMKAIDVAKDHLIRLLGSTEIPDLKSRDLTLEEVELADKAKAWDITLGYPIPEPPALKALKQITRPSVFNATIPLKKFKVVRINRENGEFISMKNIKP